MALIKYASVKETDGRVRELLDTYEEEHGKPGLFNKALANNVGSGVIAATLTAGDGTTFARNLKRSRVARVHISESGAKVREYDRPISGGSRR
ncbi:hypothetical protein BRC61_04615 [Halobacteriales archaeon QH_10_65_19]|nr:MAG: hypothetical protein BRC61_04615 [Halobacteriales archaeon QH_10_65_19]